MLPRDEAAEARTFEPVVAALESIAPGVEITRPGAGRDQRTRPDPLLRRRDGRAARAVPGGGRPAVARRRRRADRHRRRRLRRRAGRAARCDRRSRGVTAVPGRPADRDARPVRRLAADRSAAPARTAHPRRVRRAARPRRARPLRPGRRLGTPAGRRARRAPGRRRGARRSSSPSPSTSNRRSTGSTPSRSAPAGVAEQFVADLGAHGLACTCLELQAFSENGEETVRRWRHAGVLGPVDVLDRVRWQLEGWLVRRRTGPPAGGPAAARPDRGGAHRRAPAGAVGRLGGRGRTGAPRAGPGADPARARLGADPGARGRPRSRRSAPGWCRGATSRCRVALAGAAVARPATGAGAVGAARPAAAGAAARRRGRSVRGHRARRDAGAARAVRVETARRRSRSRPGPARGRWTSGGGSPACARQVGALPDRRRARARLSRHL